MKFKSKNLLVTGGSGFIGSNFIKYFFEKYNNVNIYNLDLLTYAGNIENTNEFKYNKRYMFIHGNICDRVLVKKIFTEYNIDGVINFAAESHVDNSIKHPEKFIETNINGVFNLLNVAFKSWMSGPFSKKKSFKNARFHQISTDEVYGSILKGKFKEDSNYKPNSPYSSSKASAEMIVRSFNKTFGLNTTISICSNNYGPNQNKEKFIPKVIDCLIENKSIPVYGNGNNIRNWIHVDDHASAILKIFNDAEDGKRYNVGTDFEVSNIQLIELIVNEFSNMKINVKPKISFVPDRFGHDMRYSLNSEKICNELNWKSEKELKNFINQLNIKK